MIIHAIESLKARKPVIMYDDAAISPCGFLIIPATHITEQHTAFLLNYGRGNILVSIREDHARSIGISSVTSNSKLPIQMTIGVEAREGVGSGISSKDRTHTIKAISESNSSSRLIVGPGHIYPITAARDGVLVKSSIAEASCDLMKLAHIQEVAALTHCLNASGNFSDLEELTSLSESKQIPIVTLSQIIQHRLINEKLVNKVSQAKLPTEKFGNLTAQCFVSKHDGAEHLVLIKGEISSHAPMLARMHSEKKLTDIFNIIGSQDRTKINKSLGIIASSESGILVYIKKNSKHTLTSGINSEKSSSNTSIQELRELGIGAQILRELGIQKIHLLTTQKKVLNSLDAYGITIVEQTLIEN